MLTEKRLPVKMTLPSVTCYLIYLLSRNDKGNILCTIRSIDQLIVDKQTMLVAMVGGQLSHSILQANDVTKLNISESCLKKKEKSPHDWLLCFLQIQPEF